MAYLRLFIQGSHAYNDGKVLGHIRWGTLESIVIKVCGGYLTLCKERGIKPRHTLMSVLGHEIAHCELFENGIQYGHNEIDMDARGNDLVAMFEAGEPYVPLLDHKLEMAI